MVKKCYKTIHQLFNIHFYRNSSLELAMQSPIISGIPIITTVIVNENWCLIFAIEFYKCLSIKYFYNNKGKIEMCLCC